jgi:hypothetical protein
MGLLVCLPSIPADAQEGTATLTFSNISVDVDAIADLSDILPPAFVAIKLVDDDPSDPDQHWPCRLLPYTLDEAGERFIVQHVDPGQQFALINLTDERVRFTFSGPRKIFKGGEDQFWLEPNEILLLRVRNNIKVTKKDPESAVFVWNEGCFSDLPGPFVLIP